MFNNRIKLVVFATCLLLVLSLFAGCKETKNVYDAASDYIKVSHDENANYDSPFNTDTESGTVKENVSSKTSSTAKTGSNDSSSEAQEGTAQQETTPPTDDNHTESSQGELANDSNGNGNYGPIVTF